MTYNRVLPRDLFNEAKLLKCMGKLILHIEDYADCGMQYHYDGEPFNIVQDPSDGSLSIANIEAWTADCPQNFKLHFSTPLNSRENWPLVLFLSGNGEEINVFDEEGNFTKEFENCLKD